MAFKHVFFDLDFRNSSVTTQAATIDTFFQAHTVEFWHVGENEVLFATYDDGITSGATRFTIFDSGVDGVKGDLTALNTNTTLDTLVAANKFIRMQMVDDRIILIQHITR